MSFIIISIIPLTITTLALIFYNLPNKSKTLKYSTLKTKLINTKHYILYTNNPLILIIYCIISPGCYILYLEHIQNKFDNFINSIFLIFVNGICIIGFYFYYKCVTSDPGKVTKLNSESLVERYESFYDGIIFIEKNHCGSCDVVKPARSRHCGFCDICVSRSDHHCFWFFN